MTANYILTIDEGTTSTRALIIDHDGKIIADAQREFHNIFLIQVGLSIMQMKFGTPCFQQLRMPSLIQVFNQSKLRQ